MKDLTDANLFNDFQIEFNKAQKRVIKTSDWDNKLTEIKEWQEEQERLKGRKIEDSLGGYQEYEQTKQVSPEERKAELEKNRKTEYEQKVEETRKVLGMPDPNRNSSLNLMGSYGNHSGMGMTGQRKRKNSILEKLGIWFQAAILGKELSILEVDNNKRLLKSSNGGRTSGGFGSRFNSFSRNQNTNVVESKEDQDYRMSYEDWKGYLYSYQVSGITALVSGILTALKIKFAFFVPSYFILIPSLAGLGYVSSKLKEFNDGPFAGNYLGKSDNIERAVKERKEQKKKKEQERKEKEEKEKANRFNSRRSSYDPKYRHTQSRRTRKTYNDDEDDEEDKIVLNEQEINESVDTKQEVIEDVNTEKNECIEQINPVQEDDLSEKERLKNRLLEPKEDPNNEFEIPRSKMNLKNKTEMYEFEDDFLRWVYLNRKEFSKCHEPKDILQIFAPMIVNFNSSYAVEKQVPRDSVVFKNLVYIFSRTFSQLSPKFANADEHDPNFYFCIDEIKETGLFYKVKLRLPQSIDKNRFSKNSGVLNDTLKASDKDVVDIDVEMPNDEGYIKIMRLTVNSKGSAFLPLVSTGDVLRFKGMKADGTNNGVVEQLNKPNDLSLLFGLTNAEYAKVFDIADDQNTSIAVAGFTGSGKSASTGSWLVNLLITHSPDELGIIIMDAKSGSFWENFRFAPHVLGYFGREDIEKYPTIYQILNDVYTYRQNHLNKDVRMKNFFEARKKFKENAQWDKILTVPRLLIIGDEQLATLGELSSIDNKRANKNKNLSRNDRMFAGFVDAYNTNTGSLANVVREGGMTIMGLSQRTDMKSYPRTLLGASSIKFIMKLQFQADAEKAAPGVPLPPVSNLPVGSGYIYANSVNLSQLTTPLFSGDPELLEEMTRIICLAWVIIQSYKEDLSREPQGYYLTAATKDNIKLFKENSIEPFNLFNRDKTYKEAKEILRTGRRVHFSPDAEENQIHIDLDKSEHIWDPRTGRPASENGGQDVETKMIDAKEKTIDEDTVDKEQDNDISSISDDSKDNTINKIEQNQTTEIDEQDDVPSVSDDSYEIEKNDEDIHVDKQKEEEANALLQGMLSPRQVKKEQYKEDVSDKQEQITKPKKKTSKDDLTVSDLRNYFLKNNVHSMSISDLTDEFNMETIRMAINKGIVSIDLKENKVSLI